MAQLTPQPIYRSLNVPGGLCVVRFAHVGRSNPVVCLRSLLEAVGMSWQRWEPCVLLLCRHQGWEAPRAPDAQRRRTRVLDGFRVPRLLPLLADAAAPIHPAAARRLTALSEVWGVDWVKTKEQGAATGASKDAVTARKSSGQPDLPPAQKNAHSAEFCLVPKNPKSTITRETEASVIALATAGMSRVDIARRLGISSASASLLARGKFRWSSAQAQRAASASAADLAAVPPADERSRATITRATEAQACALAAEGLSRRRIGRALGISAASVSLLVRGKYHFSNGAV